MQIGEIYTIPHANNRKSICILNSTYDPNREVPEQHYDAKDTIVLEQGRHYSLEYSEVSHEGYVVSITRYNDLLLEDIIPSLLKATFDDINNYRNYYLNDSTRGRNVTRLVFSYPRHEFRGKQTLIIELCSSQLPDGVSPIKSVKPIGGYKHD